MAIQTAGQGGVVIQADGSFAAVRSSLRPLDYATRGSYSNFQISGLIAATLPVNSPLFSFRWGDATRFAIITRVEVSCMISAAITTAVHMGLKLVQASAFSVSDTGGTAATLTSPNFKKKSSMAASLVTDIRIATTGTLTAGTRTLNAQGSYGVQFGTGTAVGSTPCPQQRIYDPYPGQECPLILAQNEGFIISNNFAGPATGSFVIGVAVDWTEIDSWGVSQLG